MDYEFPKEFDLIIVGTGVIESVISAAASRIGKRVLHIDENDYYGGQWSSFNLEALIKLTSHKNTSENIPHATVTNLHSFGNDLYSIKGLSYKFHVTSQEESIGDTKEVDNENDVKSESPENTDEPWDDKLLLNTSRKFNIDLIPKIQYARGTFVELLISSNIARYSEYRSVSRILTWFNNHLEPLPCSRSDVFANTRVSVVEKRILMKLLTSLDNDQNEMQNYENKTFREFLIDKKLTPNLIHYVLHGLSMSIDDTPYKQGIKSVKRFLTSLGRFGKTPFLFSMYGSGEIPQAFCRLSAVFGGVFALGQPIQGFALDNDKFKSVSIRSQTIEAEYMVMGINNVPNAFIKSKKVEHIARCVLITDKSIVESEKEHLTLVFYPPEEGKPFTTLLELGCLSGTCPKKLYLVHLIAKQNTSPEEDFKHIIDNLFSKNYSDVIEKGEEKPLILWSTYFSIPESDDFELSEDFPQNVFVCPGPDLDLDYDFSIEKAKQIFHQIYPDMEFLPRAPDPEDIIIGEEDENIINKEQTNDKMENENKVDQQCEGDKSSEIPENKN